MLPLLKKYLKYELAFLFQPFSGYQQKKEESQKWKVAKIDSLERFPTDLDRTKVIKQEKYHLTG